MESIDAGMITENIHLGAQLSTASMLSRSLLSSSLASGYIREDPHKNCSFMSSQLLCLASENYVGNREEPQETSTIARN